MCTFKRKLCARILACLLSCLVFWPATASAQPQTQATAIRVGFFPMEGFNEYDDHGHPQGYDVDYLNEIADITGWTYEYVNISNWDEALDKLEQGEIDLVGSAQISSGRMERFDYCKYQSGSTYGAMLALADNESLIYEDFAAFDGLRVGCVSKYIRKDDFLEYTAENACTPEMVYYDSVADMRTALETGEIQAMVCSMTDKKSNEKVLLRFSPLPFYYITTLGNDVLLKQLNDAIATVKTNNPDFENQLMDKYFPEMNQIPFTKAELDYVAEAPVFVVGCTSNRDPISYTDAKTGEITGITRDILESISRISGLKFEYAALSSGAVTYDDLRAKNVQLIAQVEQNDINQNTSGLKLSAPYLSTQRVLVCKASSEFANREDITAWEGVSIAVCAGSQTLAVTVDDKFPGAKLVQMDGIQSCMQAVLDGEVDTTLLNQYSVEFLMNKPSFEKLTVVQGVGLEQRLCLSPVVYADQPGQENALLSDERLLSIIDKSIAQLPATDVDTAIVKFTTARPYDITLDDFLYKYRNFLIALCILVVVGIVLSIYVSRLRRRHVRMIEESAASLRHIIDNINGGVVTIIPYARGKTASSFVARARGSRAAKTKPPSSQQPYQIDYASDGFLDMIRVVRSAFDAQPNHSWLQYLAQADVNKFEETVDNVRYGGKCALELNLQRQGALPLPVLLHGTVTRAPSGEVTLYGVLLDIVRHKKMIQEMEAERSKLEVLAQWDPMTGLYNKAAFGAAVQDALDGMRPGTPCAMIFTDLDNFKAINDNLGHLMGDEVIRIAARKIQGVFRAQDIVGRFGGDEFYVFLQGITRPALEQKLEVLRQTLCMEFGQEEGKHIPVTTSIGAAIFTDKHLPFDKLVDAADDAVYVAKKAGKNRYHVVQL